MAMDMNDATKVEPVRKSVTVKAGPERAFEIFTARMGLWWPQSHSILRNDVRAETVLEPRVGGRWYERGRNGGECQWGEVLVWDPPRALTLNWQIDGRWSFVPTLRTIVEIRFTDLGDGSTRVDLEHRDLEAFGEHAGATRAAFDSADGWQLLLDRFAAAA